MQVNPFNTDIIMPTYHAETGRRKRVHSVHADVITSITLLEVDECRLTLLSTGTGWKKRVNSVRADVIPFITLLEVDECRLTLLILISCQHIMQRVVEGKGLILSVLSSHPFHY